MNNDLISREILKKDFSKWFGADDIPSMVVEDIIDNAPTAEPEKICVANVRFDKEQLQEIVDKAKTEILASVERPTGKWIITAEDNDGVHRIQCPFCRYEKGSDFIDYITVTFEKFPPFCENCGAKMDGGEEE